MVIECVEITPAIRDIYSYVLTKGIELCGLENGCLCRFRLEDICYFEALDEKIFAYTSGHVYELSKVRLYELEQTYAGCHFLRCSKSMVLNLMQMDGIRDGLSDMHRLYLYSGGHTWNDFYT